MAASGMIDPTKRAKYPVVLSDALLGKASKETYTGIRYNHKPELSSETAPSTARIKQSTADEGTFNLGFDDKGNKYTYNGVRTTKDGNYVLIFDPAREVFVLHRLDSLFHMNLTRTPDNSDVDSIRKQFPQLEVQPPASGKAAGSKGEIKENVKAGSKETGTTKKPPAKNTKVSSALRKNTTNKQSQQQKKSAGTTALPETKKLMPPPPVPSTTTTPSSSRKNPSASSSSKANSKPTSEAASTSNKKRSKSPQSDEEDDDDDDGLILEFPGGPPPRTVPKYVPPATINRRFSDLYKNGDDDDADDEEANNRADASFQDADADGEDDDDDMDISFSFKTDSNSQQEQQHNVGLGLGGNGSEEPQAEVTQGGGDAAFDEADLEAEFQKDFDSESSVSEED